MSESVPAGVYQQSLGDQPTFMSRVRGDEGGIRTGLGITLGAAVLLTAGAFALKNKLPDWPGMPEYFAVPEDSDAKLRQLVLEARDNECFTLGVWDHEGSSARIKSSLPGGDSLLGKGVVAIKLKSVDETCIDGTGVSFRDDTENGEAVKVVSIERDAFRRDVKFRPEDTQIIVVPDELTQTQEAIVDLVTSGGRLACAAAKKISRTNLNCDAVNGFAQKNNLSDEALEASFLAKMEEKVRVEGGKASFDQTEELLLQRYRDKAADEGADPDRIRLELTDQGDPTDEPPSYDKPIEQELIDQGFLEKEVENGKDIEFDNVVITPLPDESYTNKM